MFGQVIASLTWRGYIWEKPIIVIKTTLFALISYCYSSRANISRTYKRQLNRMFCIIFLDVLSNQSRVSFNTATGSRRSRRCSWRHCSLARWQHCRSVSVEQRRDNRQVYERRRRLVGYLLICYTNESCTNSIQTSVTTIGPKLTCNNYRHIYISNEELILSQCLATK